MKYNVTATFLDRSGNHYILSLVCASLLTLMIVGQLFTFEEMFSTAAIASLSSDASSYIVPSVIVALELASLAYFLPLALSKAARLVGLGAAAITAVGWLWLAIMTWGSSAVFGIIGTSIEFSAVPFGALFAIVLFVLSAYIVYLDRRSLLA